MKLAPQCALVQRLNIFQSVFESITTEIDLIFGHRIEHERVIRIR